jgi:drug/metabolite transporter (DMT)-like permease
MQPAIVIAFGAMILLGINNVLQKKVVEKIGTLRNLTVRGVTVTFLLSLIALPVFQFRAPWYVYLLSFLFAVLNFLGLFFFIQALKHTKASIVIPVIYSRIIIVTAISYLVLKEDLSIAKLLLMAVILAGVILISIDLKKIARPNLNKGIVFALLAAFMGGITYPFLGMLGNEVGVILFTLMLEMMNFAAAIILIKLRNKKEYIFPANAVLKRSWKLFLGSGIISALATLTLILAFSRGKVNTIYAIIGASPLVSVIIGRVCLKEKLNLQQYLGAGAIILGVVAISFV